jgi:shikimate kinase
MKINDLTQSLAEGIKDPNIFKAIFMAGPPGAGKNRVITDLGLSYAGFKLQDIDRTLFFLKKAKHQINDLIQARSEEEINKEYDYSLKKTLVRQSLLQKNMLGLLINTTGRDSDKLMALNKELKNSGYDTFMIFVHADYNVAFDRVQDREKNATDPWDKRPVTPEYFDDAYDNSIQNLDFYKLMFGGQFAYIWNNTPPDLRLDEAILDDAPDDVFKASIRAAANKLSKFLSKPLTAKAQQIINQIKSN